MVTETQLRAATDLLVRRMDIIEGQGRMERVQDAYALANDIAHILRNDCEPAAWIIRAPNGNVRMWSQTRREGAFLKKGETEQPLYAGPESEPAT